MRIMQNETRKSGIELGVYTFGDLGPDPPNWKDNRYSTASSGSIGYSEIGG